MQATAGSSRRFTVSDGLSLQVKHFPAHDAVNCLLIHGFGDGSFVWDAFIPELDRTLNIVVPDLRGHGDSDWEKVADYRVPRHTADVQQLIAAMPPAPVLIVGHSLGAHIALRLMAFRPQRVAALVLVDFGPNLSAEGAALARENLRESLRLYSSVAEYADWLGERRPLLSEELRLRIAADSLRVCADGYRLKIDPGLIAADERDTSGESQILWDILRSVRCPMMLVRGAGSALLSRAVAQKMLQISTRARLVTVERAGHAIMTDNPQGFASAVVPFLRDVSARMTRVG